MERPSAMTDKKRSVDRSFATVIVPILEEAPVLELFLSSLIETLPEGIRVVLIDDGCTSDSKEVIRSWRGQLEDKLDLILLSNSRPMGDGLSFNEGLKHCTGNIVVRLDSDLIFGRPWLEELIAPFAPQPDIAAISGVLLYPQSGGINHAGISFYQFVSRHAFLNARPNILPRQLYKVQAMALGFSAVRRDILERSGGFDRGFNSGYDDLDLTLRMAQFGGRSMVSPSVTAFHWERSAGPYRDPSRKRNIALFWHRWGGQIEDDLWTFLIGRLEEVFKIENHGTASEMLGIDLSGDRIGAKFFWSELPKRVTLTLDDVHVLAHRCPKEGPVHLPLVLGADGHRDPRRLIILTDNFVRMRGNSYFVQRRQEIRNDDLVIDFHGNALFLHEVSVGSWPGEKIR
jgi:O-antigen biosynthesis protein